MILLGRFMSPFVRRVGVVLELLQIPYEQKIVATDKDAAEISAINPVGRVPALVLDDGEHLFDSSAIIDHLLETGDPDHALLPASGAERRAVMRLSSAGQGVMEKSVAAAYERNKRPEEFFYQPWRDHLRGQARNGVEFLNAAAAGREYLVGDALTLADIDAVIGFGLVKGGNAGIVEELGLQALEGLSERCLALPAFDKTLWRG